MLVFIDESGHPHKEDAATRPVVVAVCMLERDVRRISSQLFGLKRRVTGRPDIELKAVELLNRRTFRRVPQKRELVEAFFDLLQGLPLTVFAIAMERPAGDFTENRLFLPNQFRYLLQRVHYLAEREDEYATLLFDGNGSQFGRLAPRFESFLFRRQEGIGLTRVTEAPYFVDSRLVMGIQVADMMAGVVRIFEENALFRGTPDGDDFLSAIARYYRVTQRLSTDIDTGNGRLAGMYRMPEHAHYAWDQALPQEIPHE
jgi:Protein of unknown function (DUF3800)